MEFQFDSKTGAANVTIVQLRNTMAVGEFDGKMPAQVPMVHSDLIGNLISRAERIGIPLTIPPIVIRERYCKKNNKATNNNPEHYLVNRLVGKILFDDPMFPNSADEMKPGISFSYVYDGTLKGIQVAFGPTVSVCDNLTCFGQYRFSTNGNRRVEFEKGLQLLDGWMQNYSAIKNVYSDRIETLKSVQLLPESINMLVGDLFTRAVRANNGEKIMAPLTQSQVSGMVNEGFDRLKGEDAITGWDLLNWGTMVLKPHNSDMTDLITCTSDFNDYVYDALCVSIDKPQPPTQNKAVVMNRLVEFL